MPLPGAGFPSRKRAPPVDHFALCPAPRFPAELTTIAAKARGAVLKRLRGLFVLPILLCASDDKWLETAIFR